ncbi:hypothetical protein F4778DRAFT_779282 [Xylariomycetidae sp. FL2044]|nr:hypothetical protein F4778DRAFT_779282 [Xylariomycetidae sp. FL2044]
MFLDPRFPREAVIQRQILEGVHAVIELDFRAQGTGKISLQVFDRSGGHRNIRFDKYQDLSPDMAAQLVVRTKSQNEPAPSYGNSQYPPTMLSQYPLPAQQPPPMVSQYPPAGHQPPYGQQPPYVGYSDYHPYPASAPGANPATGNPPSSNLDPAMLQKILGHLNHPQGSAPTSNSPVDIQTLAAAGLGGTAPTAYGPPVGAPTMPSAGYVGAGHEAAMGYGGITSRPHGASQGEQYGPPHGTHRGAEDGDSAEHVKSIMAQLARYRQ